MMSEDSSIRMQFKNAAECLAGGFKCCSSGISGGLISRILFNDRMLATTFLHVPLIGVI